MTMPAAELFLMMLAMDVLTDSQESCPQMTQIDTDKKGVC